MFKGMDYVYMVYKEQSFSNAAKKVIYLSAFPKRYHKKNRK